MAAESNINKEKFISDFKAEYSLLVKNSKTMRGYKSYCKEVRILRKKFIRNLKVKGVPGELRAEYNLVLEKLSKTSHLGYLFYKNPVCGICYKKIDKKREATIDHIYPVSKGGEQSLANKQIAHGYCNALKGDTVNFEIQTIMQKTM